MMARTSTALVLLALAATAASADPGDRGPFEADEHTRLLAHYDQTVDAQVAAEDPRAEGRARFREGLFGNAMNATKGWLTPADSVADIHDYPFFEPVTYARGNVAAQSGCLEMFVNFADVVEPEYFRRVMTWEAGIYYAQGYVILALRPAEERTLQLIVKDPEGGEVTLTAPYPYEWDGQWHHIGMQWDADSYGLIIDGEVVAEKPSVADGIPEPDSRIAIGAHERGVNVSHARIDELRISDIPRY
ncbi:MAG: hypothetical protein GF393_01555 [Armatimonadia bacterium]|nr:hypothetical protein [Armatimonadia bacterium]